MQPTQTLPSPYRAVFDLDITKDPRMVLLLNAIGFVLLLGFGWLFFRAIAWLRPETFQNGFSFEFDNLLVSLGAILAILLLTILYIVLHEAIHGVFFWIFTRDRPLFAFRWTHAYAAAPSWYIPRNPFLVTTLAPLVVITVLGLPLIAIAPASWLLSIWYVLTMNAAGAVGDIIVSMKLLGQPPTCLVNDRGDAITFYSPDASQN